LPEYGPMRPLSPLPVLAPPTLGLGRPPRSGLPGARRLSAVYAAGGAAGTASCERLGMLEPGLEVAVTGQSHFDGRDRLDFAERLDQVAQHAGPASVIDEGLVLVARE